MSDRPKLLPGESLCWYCANAVPDPIAETGCEWSESIAQLPVPGWTAEPSRIVEREGGIRTETRTWCVADCPKFVKG